MRLKAIPEEIVDGVKSHPAIALAIAGVLAFGYYSYTRPAASNDASSSADTNSGYLGGMSYNMPLVYGTASGGGYDSSSVVSSGTSADTTSSTLLDIEQTKIANDYNLALATLKANSDIAAVNANVQIASLNTAKTGLLASIANTFLTTQRTDDPNYYNTLYGTITDNKGNDIAVNLSSANIEGGQKGWAETRNTLTNTAWLINDYVNGQQQDNTRNAALMAASAKAGTTSGSTTSSASVSA